MKISKITQLVIFSLGMWTGGCFAATNDALLDLLVNKGVLTSEEASSVIDELESKTPLTVKAKGKETVELRFNGRMHFQYDSLDAAANGDDLPSSNHFYFRRLRFGAKAKHESGVFAETVVDFAGNDLSVDKAIAGYQHSNALNVSLGYQKVPFGFQETTSSSKIKTIERSAANRFFADDVDFSGRHTGLHAKGNLGNGFHYAAALVNAAQGEGSKLLGASNADNDLAFFGRVQWQADNLTLGVDGGQQSNNSVVDNDMTAFTGYVNYQYDGFDILGEYFDGDLDQAGDTSGYALRVAYKFDKFEPVFRYSYINSDYEIDTDELIRRAPKSAVNGPSELDSYYFGVNYYHSKAVSLMLGYEIAEAENDTGDENEVDGLRARVQVLW